jgi:hypothetical protein
MGFRKSDSNPSRNPLVFVTLFEAIQISVLATAAILKMCHQNISAM